MQSACNERKHSFVWNSIELESLASQVVSSLQAAYSFLKAQDAIFERRCLAVLRNGFFSPESGDINLHKSLFFVVQNPFMNAEMDSAC